MATLPKNKKNKRGCWRENKAQKLAQSGEKADEVKQK